MSSDPKIGTIVDSRFQLKEFLGGGRIGKVYLAQDLEKNMNVAIKILANSLASEREKTLFDREFTAIKNLNHPGVVKVYEQGSNFFTMEYVAGASLASLKEGDVSQIFEIGMDITRVLDYIHRQSVIHRDLKPENIKLISGQKVKILDFGFATCDNIPEIIASKQNDIMGSLHYMAPEMLKGDQVDLRIDLYSIGIILYELVTGKLPFKSADLMTTIIKQVEMIPPLPSKYNEKLTPGFEGIIVKLIDKSPSKRFQNAAELLSAMLRLAGHSEILEIRVDRGHKFLNTPGFVYRKKEFKRLRSIFKRAKKGRGHLVLIKADEGMGKTRLIKEFQKKYKIPETIFIEVDCEKGTLEHVIPYVQMVKNIFLALESSSPSLLAELASKWGPTLIPLAPELSNKPYMLGVSIRAELSQTELMERLCQFLIEVSKKHLLGIFMDNLHWLDQSNCEILLKLAQTTQNYPIFLCGTYRPNFNTAESAFERILLHFKLKKFCEVLTLKPFTEEELSHFLGAMVDKEYLEGSLLKKLFEVSRGNPLLGQETIKNLADDGLIYRKGGVWKVEIDDLRKIRRPNLLEESLIVKYEQLDSKSMRIMQTAAVIGHRFKHHLIERISGMEPETIKKHMAKLVKKGFISEIAEDKNTDLIIGSPRLAKLLYEKIPIKIRQRLHEEVAKQLEKKASPKQPFLEELAHHYFRSQNFNKALEYLIAAGDLCEKQYLYNAAIDHYQNALEIAEKKSETDQIIEFLHKLGHVHSLCGDYSKALSFYNEGLKLAPKHKQRREENAFHKGVGLALFKKGELEEALKHFQILLENLREENKDMAEERALTASVYIAIGEYTQAEGLLKKALDQAKQEKNKELQGVLYNSFAEIHFMKGHWPNAMNYYLRAFDLLQTSEDYHLKTRIAKGIARIYIRKGQTQEAYKFIEQALYWCQLTGDREFKIMVEIDLGLLFQHRGQLGKAVEIYRESLELAEDLEIKPGVAHACMHLGRAMTVYEKYQEATKLIKQSLQNFTELKIQWGIGECYRLLGEIYTDQGEYELAKEAFDTAETEFSTTHMKWLMVGIHTGAAEVLRKTGQIEIANKKLNKALKIARKYDDDIMLGRIHTKYALFCADSDHSQESLEHFISATVFLERVTCLLDLAKTYYEYGRILLAFERKGDPGFIKVAINQLEKAKEIYHKAGLQPMLNKTVLLIKECERERTDALHKRDIAVKLREYGRQLSEFERDAQKDLQSFRVALLEEMGKEMNQQTIIDEVEKRIAQMQEQLNSKVQDLREQNGKLLSQVEQLKTERESLLTLQKISNTINSVLDSKKLLDLIMDMVIKELRAERGFIVLTGEDNKITFKAARNIDKEELSLSDSSLSTSIVKKVIKTCEPVLTSDAQADGRFQSQSITDLKLRSILCVPFAIKDKLLGAVYVDNRFVSGLFTERDLEFLMAFSNQAAIAIENAFLYEELAEKERIEQEINIAARIQRGLLPKNVPQVEGIEAYGKMIPARKVGGDYYDFIESPDKTVLSAVIGDVSGKGVPAGLVMVMARLILHYFLRESVATTKEPLLAANRLLKDNTEPYIFMSMLLARWDSKTKKFTYTGAGHENLIIYRAQRDDLEVIPAGGVVLGVKENIDSFLSEKELQLNQDDTLILYTDGVTESISPSGDMLEMDGFKEMLRKHCKKTPKDLVEGVLEDLHEFTGVHQEQNDDITLTALRKT